MFLSFFDGGDERLQFQAKVSAGVKTTTRRRWDASFKAKVKARLGYWFKACTHGRDPYNTCFGWIRIDSLEQTTLQECKEEDLAAEGCAELTLAEFRTLPCFKGVGLTDPLELVHFTFHSFL